MCLICGNDYSKAQFNKQKLNFEDEIQQKDTEIQSIREQAQEKIKKWEEALKNRDSTIADLQEEIQRLNEENNSLEKKCAKRLISYIKQPIEIQCPYCNHQEKIESTGEEPIKIAEILSRHISEAHIPQGMIDTKNNHPECVECQINMANIEVFRNTLQEREKSIYEFMATQNWEYLGEEDGKIGLAGFIDGQPKIILVPKIIISQIPKSIEGETYVYKDGSRFPKSLIVSLKKDVRVVERKIGLKTTPTALPTDQSPSPIADDKEESNCTLPVVAGPKLSPNEEKILGFLRDHPSSTNADISNGSGIDRANVSRYVGSLKDKGIITIYEDGRVDAN